MSEPANLSWQEIARMAQQEREELRTKLVTAEVDNARLREALKELLEGCCALNDEQAILPRQMQAARRALEQKP